LRRSSILRLELGVLAGKHSSERSDEAIVTVTLLHADGSAVAGLPVQLMPVLGTVAGLGLTIQQPLTLTDSKGRATGRVTRGSLAASR